MRPEQWRTFQAAARREKLPHLPVALIVDSPWIPGHLGIGHLDYFFEVLRQANGEGIILSVGGGVSPGMPAANIRALVEAAGEFDAGRAPTRASGAANR